MVWGIGDEVAVEEDGVVRVGEGGSDEGKGMSVGCKVMDIAALMLSGEAGQDGTKDYTSLVGEGKLLREGVASWDVGKLPGIEDGDEGKDKVGLLSTGFQTEQEDKDWAAIAEVDVAWELGGRGAEPEMYHP